MNNVRHLRPVDVLKTKRIFPHTNLSDSIQLYKILHEIRVVP